MADRDRLACAGMVFAALVFALYAGLILLHPQVPLLGDLPAWNVSSLALAHHLHGVPDAFHAVKTYPVPNSTIVVLPALFMLVFPPELAVRLFLVLYLAAAFFSVRAVLRAVPADPVLWWIVPAGCFLGLNFWWGSLGFLFGIALLLFFLAALVRREEVKERSWVLGVLLTALFLTHMVPFTFALLLLVLFAVQFSRWRVLWQAVPSLVLLAWYVVGRFSSGNVDAAAAPTSLSHLYGPAFWLLKANAFLKSFGLVNPVDPQVHASALHALVGSAGFLLVLLLNVALCAAALVVLVKYGTVVATTRPYVWLAVALSVPAFLLVPMSLLGISDPASRIVQTVVFPLLVVLPRSVRRGRSLVVLAVCSAALTCMNAGLFARLPWTDSVPRGARVFPERVETLGKVPYTSMSGFRQTLRQRDWSPAGFETSVLRNIHP